jgi:hypothetical protein
VSRFWQFQQKYAPFWPVVGCLLTITLAWKLFQISSAAHSTETEMASLRADLILAESTVVRMERADSLEAVQRDRDQFIIDSLSGVISFQAKAIDRWKAAKGTMRAVDPSLAVEVQLENCQDNVRTLLAAGNDLSESLAVAKFAADSAIAVATAANVRADSADARRALAADSVTALLRDAAKKTRRPWYKKLWGGTVDVMTTTAKVGAGILIGRAL